MHIHELPKNVALFLAGDNQRARQWVFKNHNIINISAWFLSFCILAVSATLPILILSTFITCTLLAASVFSSFIHNINPEGRSRQLQSAISKPLKEVENSVKSITSLIENMQNLLDFPENCSTSEIEKKLAQFDKHYQSVRSLNNEIGALAKQCGEDQRAFSIFEDFLILATNQNALEKMKEAVNKTTVKLYEAQGLSERAKEIKAQIQTGRKPFVSEHPIFKIAPERDEAISEIQSASESELPQPSPFSC